MYVCYSQAPNLILKFTLLSWNWEVMKELWLSSSSKSISIRIFIVPFRAVHQLAGRNSAHQCHPVAQPEPWHQAGLPLGQPPAEWPVRPAGWGRGWWPEKGMRTGRHSPVDFFVFFFLIPVICSLLKNPPANARDTSLIPGIGQSPGEGNSNPP